MKKIYVVVVAWVVLVGGLLPARGQGPAQNWYFGTQAGVRFGSAGPVALTDGALQSYEGCATLSDDAGQLLAYTNGEIIWNRQHQPMPNGGSGLGGHNSASQTAMLLPLPGSTTKVFLFCVDAIDNDLVGGLRYSIVDFSLRGGLGDVTSTKGVRLPTPTLTGRVTEKLTAARHANGRDYWIIVHGWESDAFYSFLLSPAGLSTTPVISNSGSVHEGGGSFFGDGNAIGCMKVSPDGRHLALAQRDNLTELYSFDNATGQVANYVPLQALSYNYGIEFSPDNSRLYVALTFGRVVQYNLLAGSANDIASSVTTVATSNGRFGSIQLGPDGRIYITAYNTAYLDVIANPNALGTACRYQAGAVALGNRIDQNGLPNFPNAFAAAPSPAPQLAIAAAGSCGGTATTFTGTITPALNGAVATWNFGDPASGSANTATGLTTSHLFSHAGIYQVTLTVTHPLLAAPVTSTQAVTITPLPTPRLPADTLACAGSVQLRPRGVPASSAYRWQDGSTSSTYLATANGVYTVQVTTPQGCVGTATSRVALGQAPVVSLGADTVVCASATWVLRPTPQPAGTAYRWQDGSTAAVYVAHGPGTYSVEVRSGPGGCPVTATRLATLANCPVFIPNIITPNGDNQNEAFVLKGLTASEWHLRIFDRWGRQVYDRPSYDNGWQAAGQSSGVYYYSLTNAYTSQHYQGWIEVVQPN